MKVHAYRDNACAALAVIYTHGSLDRYFWSFVDGSPVLNRWQHAAQVPATTPVSEHMSKALRKQGFRFVGPTICYAFMQATGMANDHVVSCFRHAQVGIDP
jgi:DNA-3-methyladenine glycosylase I